MPHQMGLPAPYRTSESISDVEEASYCPRTFAGRSVAKFQQQQAGCTIACTQWETATVPGLYRWLYYEGICPLRFGQ